MVVTPVASGGVSSTEVNVLQAINLTLGTSSFLALGDSLPATFNVMGADAVGRVCYIVLLILWTIKLLVENHRGFATDKMRNHPNYAIFQLAMTILMFLALIAAARKIDAIATTTGWLSISLGFGLVWLAGKVGFHWATNGFDRTKYPWHWLASDLITVAGAGYIAIAGLGFASLMAIWMMFLMIVSVVADAIISKSFSL